jgi:hypothetical protein
MAASVAREQPSNGTQARALVALGALQERSKSFALRAESHGRGDVGGHLAGAR